MTEYQNFYDIYNWIALNGNPQFVWYNAWACSNLTLFLLTTYETECINFLNDTSDEKSLLAYVSGNDPVTEINNHKSFLTNYGVYLY